MKFADAIKEANESRDPKKWEEVLLFMRFNLGLTYLNSMLTVKKVYPDLTLPVWDELCLEIDNQTLVPGMRSKL